MKESFCDTSFLNNVHTTSYPDEPPLVLHIASHKDRSWPAVSQVLPTCLSRFKAHAIMLCYYPGRCPGRMLAFSLLSLLGTGVHLGRSSILATVDCARKWPGFNFFDGRLMHAPRTVASVASRILSHYVVIFETTLCTRCILRLPA